MARYKAGQKDVTREKILKSASKLFRRNGYSSTGVDKIMSSVGLTSGGFYSHFSSKEQLFREAVSKTQAYLRKQAYVEGLEQLQPDDWYDNVVKRLLSRWHRDHIDEGCALTALVSDVGRAPGRLKELFESEIKEALSLLEKRMPGDSLSLRQERSLFMLIVFVGAISFSRAVKDQGFSDQILLVARKYLSKSTVSGG